MPSLIRFLVIVGILVGLVYGGMIALVTLVEPQPREMTQTLPASKLNK
ncbi:MAG: histidine kinase [Methylobacteriaceae bacterium]|nr:histidine kinase [Methylobacteriaceae bacterium]